MWLRGPTVPAKRPLGSSGAPRFCRRHSEGPIHFSLKPFFFRGEACHKDLSVRLVARQAFAEDTRAGLLWEVCERVLAIVWEAICLALLCCLLVAPLGWEKLLRAFVSRCEPRRTGASQRAGGISSGVPSALVPLRRQKPAPFMPAVPAFALASFRSRWHAVGGKWPRRWRVAFWSWQRRRSSAVGARTASAVLHTPRRQLTGLLQHQCSSGRLQTLLGKPMVPTPGCSAPRSQPSSGYA